MQGKQNKDQERFEIQEMVCANTPSNQHYLIVQAKDRQTNETVWAIGDDHVCAVTRADFIRNREIEYNDVLIQEFPYRDNTPESVGEWRPLIRELVDFMLHKYMEHDDLVHVYPQWLPDDIQRQMADEWNQLIAENRVDHIILYEEGIMEIVPHQGERFPQEDEDEVLA